MKISECKELIKEDLARWADTIPQKISTICFNNIVKTTVLFRIVSYLKTAPIFLKIICFPCRLLFRHYVYKTGIQIVSGTRIRGGVKFIHFGGIVINGGAIIGKNCTIYHGVTIGASLYMTGPTAKIGNNVVISTGAKILGNVKIGDNAIIAANSVVTHDVPSGAIVAGIPAKVISMNGEEKSKLWLATNCKQNKKK